eukprot:1482651-Pyramimonas_sp.AAC.1
MYSHWAVYLGKYHLADDKSAFILDSEAPDGLRSEVDQQATVMFVALTAISKHWTAEIANHWDEEYPPSSPDVVLQRAVQTVNTDFDGGYRYAPLSY